MLSVTCPCPDGVHALFGHGLGLCPRYEGECFSPVKLSKISLALYPGNPADSSCPRKPAAGGNPTRHDPSRCKKAGRCCGCCAETAYIGPSAGQYGWQRREFVRPLLNISTHVNLMPSPVNPYNASGSGQTNVVVFWARPSKIGVLISIRNHLKAEAIPGHGVPCRSRRD